MSLIRYIFVILNIVASGLAYNVLLIKDYFSFNYITTGLFISCESQSEVYTIETIKDLQIHGIWLNSWDISDESFSTDFNYDKFFVRFTHPPCIVINLECNQTSEFMTQMSKRILFHYERNWLMFSASLEEAFNILSQQNINVDAEISLAIPTAQNGYSIYEVFNPSHIRGGRLNITLVGNWNEGIGWNIPLKQTKIERRRDLNGIILPTVIPLTNIPRNKTVRQHLYSNELVHLDGMSRFMYRLFALMMDMYNFNVNLRFASFRGRKDSMGAWHGAIGALNRSQVDLCISGLRWTDERYGVYEHTAAAFYAQFLFVFRHPKSAASTNLFLSPFDYKVWVAIIGLSVLTAIIIRQLFFFENHKKLCDSAEKADNFNENSYSNTGLMVFGYIFQQGYAGNPVFTSSRVLTFSILSFSVLIFQFYSSYIVASLLTEAPKNIKTVKQLLNSRFEFGIDVDVLDIFHCATDESTIELYNKIMKNPGKAVMSLESGVDMLKKGGFVFNTDGGYAYHVIKRTLTDSEICDLQDITYLPKEPVGPGVASKSPYKEMIKISIRKFTETGISSYFNKIWYGVRPKCGIKELFVPPVDIIQFAWALYMLLAGILTSITIFIFESTFNYYLKDKMPSKSKKR